MGRVLSLARPVKRLTTMSVFPALIIMGTLFGQHMIIVDMNLRFMILGIVQVLGAVYIIPAREVPILIALILILILPNLMLGLVLPAL